MKKSMVELQETLAMEIFSRRFVELNLTQQAFVDYHVGAYHTYEKKIAPMLREALSKKKLGNEYIKIFELYKKRLPPLYVQTALEKGKEEARKQICTTFSIGWFENHFNAFIEKYKNDVADYIEGRIDCDIDYPWFFNVFKYIYENDTSYIFDPWWGFRKRKKRKLSLEEMLQKAKQGVETNESLIKLIRERINKMDIDKETKIRYRNRLNYIIRKKRKLQERRQDIEKKWKENNGE